MAFFRKFLNSCSGIISIGISILIFVLRTSAAPLQPYPSRVSHTLSRQTSDRQCGIDGNADLYGLGIRVGIYLQWLSGLLANSVHVDSVSDRLATNTIFLLATYIALAIITSQRIVRGAEVIILLQLSFGFIFTSLTTWGFRVGKLLTPQKQHDNRVLFSLAGSLFRSCLSSAICFYNLWFWFVGVDALDIPTCPTWAFLFVAVDIGGSVRAFFKTTAVLMACVFAIAAASEILLFGWSWAFYCLMALMIAFNVGLQRMVSSTVSGKKSLKEPRKHKKIKKVGHILAKVSTYSLAACVGIPWVILNGASTDNITRLQSWLLIAITCVVTGIAIGILTYILYSEILGFIWDCIKSIGRLFTLIPQSLSAFKLKLLSRQSLSDSNASPTHTSTAIIQTPTSETKGEIPTENPGQGLTDQVAIDSKPGFTAEVGNVSQPGHQMPRTESDGATIEYPKETASKAAGLPRSTPSPRPSQKTTSFQWAGSKISEAVLNVWVTAGSFELSERKALKALPAINAVCLVWSLVAIELMIKWNHIEGVYSVRSVGQLIPLIIGIVSFVKLISEITVEKSVLYFSDESENSKASTEKYSRKEEDSKSATVDWETMSYSPTQPLRLCRPGSRGSPSRGVQHNTWVDNDVKNTPGPFTISCSCPTGPFPAQSRLSNQNSTGTEGLFQDEQDRHHNVPPATPWRGLMQEIRSLPHTYLFLPIGDQIMSMLEGEVQKGANSEERPQIMQLIKIFNDSKAKGGAEHMSGDEMEGIMLRFRGIGISPNDLIVRWLRYYTRAWLNYGRERWRIRGHK